MTETLAPHRHRELPAYLVRHGAVIHHDDRDWLVVRSDLYRGEVMLELRHRDVLGFTTVYVDSVAPVRVLKSS